MVRPGFNGATAMKPWKRLERMTLERRYGWLQWGHGDEAVEEDVAKPIPDVLQVASMGPRR